MSEDCYKYSALDNPTTEYRNDLTVDYCLNLCKDFTLAAISNGDICGCTNKPINFKEEVGKDKCSSECSGQANTTRLCGGPQQWTIYVPETYLTTSTTTDSSEY